MINDSRNALGSNYTNDTKPYRQITRMAAECDNLNTAYQMLQLDVYADKMVQNVRCLLAVEPDKKVINNDFNAGELIYTTKIVTTASLHKSASKWKASLWTYCHSIIKNT